MVQIIPTLFSTTEEEYKARLAKLKLSTSFTEGWVQLDLMDNKFVPKMGISLEIVKRNPPPFNVEAQLMVIDPGEWIDGLIELKVNRIIIPVEDQNILEYIKKIRDNNIEVGLSINPDTEAGNLDQYFSLLDAVLVMGVNPGLEKQQLGEDTYQKVKDIKQKMPNIKIGVDGGVNETNIKQLVEVGVDYLAIGSYLFTGDFDENLETLWEIVNG
ncbi:hypothetical protein A3C59_02850 [Candidatus Daviesbacteria bacterium RIFCSPHIGHO2_02_FULL_36_13]|uniref:Ribulose-phosphate 3-epimerase n=1 Tax=Candidatus Daviesbacteria bacterium RIFCSPHIGHO2_02_FULL_36_13 TaxID=1797768 RepID=A0A1F5JXE8_9BACT|nr:MAG: hypothetical protein A3C59_02850 [Candidatus Daviesbacteria bacterium RIFCSPHIGHO2_02_FULL_36_13]